MERGQREMSKKRTVVALKMATLLLRALSSYSSALSGGETNSTAFEGLIEKTETIERDDRSDKFPLLGGDWKFQGEWRVEDAIYSLLVEAPLGIYMTADCHHFFLIVRGRGLMHVTGDFTNTTDDELDILVTDILEAYSA